LVAVICSGTQMFSILSNWLVNKAKVEPKTVQGILRHSRIQTTLDLYTREDSVEKQAAQGRFLEAVWLPERCNELCGTVCGTDFSRVSGVTA